MKRSTINQHLRKAAEFFGQHQFLLPFWAFWSVDQWRKQGPASRELISNQLGWDITDFGSGEFERQGLILFTLRNGNPLHDRKPYAEKIMLVEENQETPLHFHWKKMEDIINRGGGNLVLQLYHADAQEALDANRPVLVSIDGIQRELPPGGLVDLAPGESVCLEQNVYHRFYGKPGAGKVLVGEVSQTNDDDRDNRFLAEVGRFPQIEEDEPLLYPLAKDYPTLFKT